MKKTFVDVILKNTKEGKKIPLEIIWKDGKSFTIDKVLDIQKAASLKVGGQGIRYTCRILNQNTYLFFEDPQWFVEEK